MSESHEGNPPDGLEPYGKPGPDGDRAPDQTRARLEALEREVELLHEELETARSERDQLRREVAEIRSPRRPGSKLGRGIMAVARFGYRFLPLPHFAKRGLRWVAYLFIGLLAPNSHTYRRYVQSRLLGSPAGTFSAEPGAGAAPVDIILFPVIDWEFRFQRPQHLARQLAKQGHRVFYLRTRFSRSGAGEALDPKVVSDNVLQVTLPCSGKAPVIYAEAPSSRAVKRMLGGIETLRRRYGIGSVACLVQHPFWTTIALSVPGARVIYDCMDHHQGFSNTGTEMNELEAQLFASADLTITTSQRLDAMVAPRARRSAVIRNAADFEHFSERPRSLAVGKKRPVVGYYGAIAEWFDGELVAEAARALPECDFVLIGDTLGADLSALKVLPNVHLLGEVPYDQLPRYAHAFDVCMIPFRKTPLTECTNPVKVYEYLSMGKPVVGVDLPELLLLGDVVRIGRNPQEFVEEIREAIRESDEGKERRREVARENTWEQRGKVLSNEIRGLFPRVSIIVLTFNQLSFTKACLQSLTRFTRYGHWELILVDNASGDGTPDFLREFAKENKEFVKLVLNEENKGFAAGNNIGAAQATGDYLVFLNNDTYVTSRWVEDLVRHFEDGSRLGLLNPVTNNVGNEARIDIHYSNMMEMALTAREYTTRHAGQRLPLSVTAFYCVMVPREVWDEIGPLDEGFGMGFFEDDDYSRRVREAGYEVACAEDVFVHHHLSASFDALGEARKKEIFERSREYYESKWGPWTPHKYRTRADPKAESRT